MSDVVLQVQKFLLLHVQSLLFLTIIEIHLSIVKLIELTLMHLILEVLRVKNLIVFDIAVTIKPFLKSFLIDLPLFIVKS